MNDYNITFRKTYNGTCNEMPWCFTEANDDIYRWQLDIKLPAGINMLVSPLIRLSCTSDPQDIQFNGTNVNDMLELADFFKNLSSQIYTCMGAGIGK